MLTSKLALLALLSALALIGLSAACAGGGDEDERVPIRRIDFTGVELSAADFFDPPFVDQYPEVVAEVNGEPITGEALVRRQVMLELSRRQLIGDTPEAFPEEYVSQQVADIESTDPLEAVIDQELERQAVERLDLLPSYDEAVAFTHEAEEAFRKARDQGLLEQRQETEELLRLLDMPAEDWASHEEVVERYRQQMGIGALRNSVCKEVRTQTPGVLSVGRDCTEFLAEERDKADIRYFVEWVE